MPCPIYPCRALIGQICWSGACSEKATWRALPLPSNPAFLFHLCLHFFPLTGLAAHSIPTFMPHAAAKDLERNKRNKN